MKQKAIIARNVRQNFFISAVLVIPFLLLVAWIIQSTTFQIGGQLVSRVETSEKVVALTFDDGPETPYSDDLLRILQNNEVKATFFVIGIEAERHQDAMKRLASSGHQIGNHSYSHGVMVFRGADAIRKEIETTDRLIREAGYDGEIAFRPPYGYKFVQLPRYLDSKERPLITWSMSPDTNSADQKPGDIVEAVTRDIQPGSIIVLHGMYKHNQPVREALPSIIERLKSDGYQFVTVSELLSYR